jgi:hypothetical protein
MMRNIYLTLLILCFVGLQAQNKALLVNTKKLKPTERDSFALAERLVTDEMNYKAAIPIYEVLKKRYPKTLYFTYRLGECYLHKSDEYKKAVEYFEAVNEKEPKAADIKYFLGQAYLLNYQLDDAIRVFNEYLNQKISKEQKEKTEHFIENCKNAKILMANPREAKITNIGRPINSEFDEYVPVISADESVMIFTYRGEKSTGGKMNSSLMQDNYGTFFEDVFISYKDSSGNWIQPKSIGENINTMGHDAAIALSPDGQTLFIYKNISDLNGDIYFSRTEGKSWSNPLPLPGKVNTEHWEGSASLSADGKILYFSSNKPGGYGGKDIYRAKLQDDGTWGEIQNLGNSINTQYDDDAPFIHPDGKTLFFSSKGHNSMGGYDIFISKLQNDGTFTSPKNIGYPINTVDNDIYYVLNASGKRGYYSSGKPGGFGGQDIYIVEPGILDSLPKLTMVKGYVTLDNVPVSAHIVVYDEDTKEKIIETQSTSETGKYLLNLPPDRNYLVMYSVDDGDIPPVELTIEKHNEYKELPFDVNFISLMKVEDDSILVELDTKQDSLIEAPKEILPEKPLTELTDEEIIKYFGDKKSPGLVFKVQIAAYRFPENYTYNHLKDLGTIDKELLQDGVTRFTIGKFDTLNEAIAFNKKVHNHGQEDAFVIAVYNGKRKYLNELVAEGILK